MGQALLSIISILISIASAMPPQEGSADIYEESLSIVAKVRQELELGAIDTKQWSVLSRSFNYVFKYESEQRLQAGAEHIQFFIDKASAAQQLEVLNQFRYAQIAYFSLNPFSHESEKFVQQLEALDLKQVQNIVQYLLVPKDAKDFLKAVYLVRLENWATIIMTFLQGYIKERARLLIKKESPVREAYDSIVELIYLHQIGSKLRRSGMVSVILPNTIPAHIQSIGDAMGSDYSIFEIELREFFTSSGLQIDNDVYKYGFHFDGMSVLTLDRLLFTRLNAISCKTAIQSRIE